MHLKNRGGITIITLSTRRKKRIFSDLISVFKKYVFTHSRYTTRNPSGGPSSVLRSLVRGLSLLDIPYNLNPQRNCVRKNCIVLSDVLALEEAIALKEEGIINVLLAGPNIVTFPEEYDHIVMDVKVDRCVVPSDWVQQLYSRNLPFEHARISVWPAGVDLNMWPDNMGANLDHPTVLIYLKHFDDQRFSQQIFSYFNEHGWNVEVVVYGEYRQDEFSEILHGVNLAIFLSITESQGIALAEVWASNVPTFVLRRDYLTLPDGSRCEASSAPYLNRETGMFFNSFGSFLECMDEFWKEPTSFKPRNWVSQNMTDEICAEKLIGMFNDES